MKNLRSWKLLLPLAGLARRCDRSGCRRVRGAAGDNAIKVAIMTDCKGAFAFGYELDIGGAQAAFAQYAGGKVEEQEQAVGRHDGHQGRRQAGQDRRLRLRRRHGRRPR